MSSSPVTDPARSSAPRRPTEEGRAPTGWLRRELAPAALVGVAGIVVAFVVLRLWNADFGVPFAYQGDALFYNAIVKQVLQQGWVLSNPDLGAPYGLDLHDFPLFSVAVVPFLMIKVIGTLTGGDFALTINLYYLLTFGLVASSAFAFMRWLRVSSLVAAACALIYALSPYHLWHNQGHLLASSYYLVPVGAYLAIAIARGARLFARREGDAPRALCWASSRTLVTLGLCVLVGWSDIYYISLTLLVLVGVGVVTTVARRRLGPLVAAVLASCAIAAATVVAVSPVIVYRLKHGPNKEAAQRLPGESEDFSTNIAQLVMPVPGHPIGPLDRLQATYQAETKNGKEPTPLGLATVIGLVWLALVALAALVRPVRGPPEPRESALDDQRGRHLSLVALITLAIATTGGVSSLIAWGVSPALRDWGRAAIIIALVAVAGLGLLLDLGIRGLRRRRRLPPEIVLVGLAVLVVLAMVDQTNSKALPPYAANRATWRADSAFVGQIERSLPNRAEVFQIPYMPFPEGNPVFGTHDSEPFAGYLHSDRLRWSYAAMRGRPADWQSTLADRPPAQMLPAIAAAGFQGLWVDRAGYADGGKQIDAQIQAIVGSGPAATRSDGRYAFWDLRAYAARFRHDHPARVVAALAQSTLKPVRWLYLNRKAWKVREVTPAGSSRSALDPSVKIELDNPAPRVRVSQLTMRLSRPGEPSAPIAVRYPDGTSKVYRATDAGTPVSETIRVPPGRSDIALRALTPAAQANAETAVVYVQVNQLQIVDPFAVGLR
jgi:phosphoglycerol transferase